MTGRVADLEARLGRQEASSFGSIHIQTDDLSAVEQAVRQFVPRLPGGSRGSLVAPPRHGWIAVYDDVCDRNPEMLRRLARELSDRMGAVVLAARRRARRAPAHDPLRARADRGRVPVRPRVLRPAAAGRRRRARREPARRLAAHGRRAGGGAPDRAHRVVAGRPCRRRASSWPSSRLRWASRAPSTAGRTRRRSKAPCGSSAREGPAPARAGRSDERMWEPQLSAAREAGFEPVAPRLYGRGASIDGWAAQLLGEVEGRSSRSARRWAATARSRSPAARPSASSGSRSSARAPDADSAERRRFRDELIAQLRAEGVPPDLETDVPAEELAVAQEAMRDRPDLTGVAASFGGPLLVCVGEADEIVSVEEARAIAGQRARRLARGLRGRGAPAQRRPAGALQRGAAGVPRAMADIALEELRRRLGEDGPRPPRRADAARVLRSSPAPLRSPPGPHPRRA